MTDLRDARALSAPPVPSRWATPVLLTGTCLIVLDFFIVTVALISVQRDLRAGPTAVERVVAGYGLTFAVLLLAAGREQGWPAWAWGSLGLAGAVGGLMSTLQQVGNSIGVAVVGPVFFGTAGSGHDRAFGLGSLLLAVLLVAVAGCATRLPRRTATR